MAIEFSDRQRTTITAALTILSAVVILVCVRWAWQQPDETHPTLDRLGMLERVGEQITQRGQRIDEFGPRERRLLVDQRSMVIDQALLQHPGVAKFVEQAIGGAEHAAVAADILAAGCDHRSACHARSARSSASGARPRNRAATSANGPGASVTKNRRSGVDPSGAARSGSVASSTR